MKRLFTILSFVLVLTFSVNNQSQSQTGFNTVLEYATGTWCGYCPCGHVIVDGILTNYPETVVLAYHGGNGSPADPWKSYSAGMISLFGFSGYPTGVVGRKSGILSRSAWNNQVVLQSNTTQPTVSINLASMNYNSTTRQMTATVEVEALTALTGEHRINFVLTEDNLVYPQNFYADCGTAGVI